MTHPAISAHITCLYTSHPDQTAEFYEETMGLRLHFDQGTCRIYEISSNNYLGFCQQEAPPAETIRGGKTQVTVTLVTPDVDGWYEYLGQQGVEVHKAPAVNTTYNIYHRILRDPNGYLIEIQRFLQHSRLRL